MGFKMTTSPISSGTTADAAAFFRLQRVDPLKNWKGLCLQLQRMARVNIPAVHASALGAALATPDEDRIYRVDDLRRGMVAYFDDPNDSNPFGHIVYVAGRFADGTLMCWSNDVDPETNVGLVPFSFFQKFWGDGFMFGAISLNGWDLLGNNGLPMAKPGLGHLGANYVNAIKGVKRAISHHRNTGNARLVRALQRELKHLQKLYEEYKLP